MYDTFIVMNKVYLALRGTNQNFGTNVLGVFSTKESAIDCCLNQPTHMWGAKWNQDHSFVDQWTNGEGLFVKVEEYVVLD